MSDVPQKITNSRLINIGRLSREKRDIDRQVLLFEFERLMKMVPSVQSNPKLKVALNFWIDDSNLIRIDGSIQGSVDLVCQRCLECYAEAVDVTVSLAYFESEDRLQRAENKGLLPDDDVDILVLSPIADVTGHEESAGLLKGNSEEMPCHVDMIQIIEDDLILALPQVPKHPQIADQGEGEGEGEESGGKRTRKTGKESSGCLDQNMICKTGDNVTKVHANGRKVSKLAEGLAAIRSQLSQNEDS